MSKGSNIQAGIIDEDNTPFVRNISEGQTVTIPQALM